MEIPTFARVGMVGHTGCGKTILADWMARQWVPTAGAIFIIDPKLDPDSVWRDWGVTVDDCEQAAEAYLDGHRIIRLAGVWGDENYDFIELAQTVPRVRLVVDESANLLPTNMNHAPECFQKLVNQGRIFEQGIMLLGQVYSQLPYGYRTQAHIFAANQPEGTGKVWLKERYGKLETVPPFHWFVSAPDTDTMIMDPCDLVPALTITELPNPVPHVSKSLIFS